MVVFRQWSTDNHFFSQPTIYCRKTYFDKNEFSVLILIFEDNNIVIVYKDKIAVLTRNFITCIILIYKLIKMLTASGYCIIVWLYHVYKDLIKNLHNTVRWVDELSLPMMFSALHVYIPVEFRCKGEIERQNIWSSLSVSFLVLFILQKSALINFFQVAYLTLGLLANLQHNSVDVPSLWKSCFRGNIATYGLTLES